MLLTDRIEKRNCIIGEPSDLVGRGPNGLRSPKLEKNCLKTIKYG